MVSDWPNDSVDKNNDYELYDAMPRLVGKKYSCIAVSNSDWLFSTHTHTQDVKEEQ